MKIFRQLDIFQKLNQDIDTSSATGGIYSIIALIVGLVLFYTECIDYTTHHLVYTMKVLQLQSQILQANIDITVFGSPCHLLSLDLQDEVGNHIIDYTDTITKKRVLKDGTQLLQALGYGEDMSSYRGSDKEVLESIEGINNEEGCRFSGHLNLKNVPGNFHISYHAKMDVVNRISVSDYEAFKKMNLNYKIHHLGLGNHTKIHDILKQMGSQFQLETIEHYPFDDQTYTLQGKHTFDNYLKILPAHYENTYQSFSTDRFKFTMYTSNTKGIYLKSKQFIICFVILSYFNYNQPMKQSETATIYFRYEISPINVYYKSKSKSVYHFAVQICAIIGGILSVMGILSSLTTNAITSIQKSH